MAMVKLSKLRSAEEIAADELRDPRVRREYERTAFANAVAIRVICYRADHGLSQTALARQLGMRQPAIARLEAGEHEPSLATLARLAQGLGIDFSIEITPTALALKVTA
ncbi:MAG: helix-turn-helix transcriptional regulator [Nocardioidaceae bacterium]